MEQLVPVLIDYGIGGIFIAYLIFQDYTRMKRIMSRVDEIERKVEDLFREQRVQDKEQQEKLFDLLRNNK